MDVPSARPPVGPVRIPSVDWWITSRCNLACDFCYGPAPTKDPVTRREMIFRAIRESSAAAVTFCGGEPLLVRSIDKYAAILAAEGKRTILNTNGALLRRRVDEGLTLPFDVIGISIDGSTEVKHREMRGPGADLREALCAADLVARQPGTRLKVATVVSAVNKDDLYCISTIVGRLKPDVWRLYQYSSRGAQNSGQKRHHLSDYEFCQLVTSAAKWVAPIVTSASSEGLSTGCLIVNPEGIVLQPNKVDYVEHGNCLTEPLDLIWAKNPARAVISVNKRWLSLMGASEGAEQAQLERGPIKRLPGVTGQKISDVLATETSPMG
jgi:MoaA/NifB/PqqE/SkfB family radical SAM enzyme